MAYYAEHYDFNIGNLSRQTAINGWFWQQKKSKKLRDSYFPILLNALLMSKCLLFKSFQFQSC